MISRWWIVWLPFTVFLTGIHFRNCTQLVLKQDLQDYHFRRGELHSPSHDTGTQCFITPPLTPGGVYFFYKTRNRRVLHPTAYDNQVFGTIYKNEIGPISDMHVSRGGCCGDHFSVCI